MIFEFAVKLKGREGGALFTQVWGPTETPFDNGDLWEVSDFRTVRFSVARLASECLET
jgi:hypothetical protein